MENIELLKEEIPEHISEIELENFELLSIKSSSL